MDRLEKEIIALEKLKLRITEKEATIHKIKLHDPTYDFIVTAKFLPDDNFRKSPIILEYASSREEGDYLAKEYRLAFGNEWGVTCIKNVKYKRSHL